MKSIPYGRQFIDHDDIELVVQTLKSDFLTQGPLIDKFEKKLSRKVGAKYCAVVNSATSALHVSCLALGLRKNDLMWTVPNSFVASANCGLYCGANIDFVDINIETGNIDVSKLNEKLLIAKKRNKLPKILIPVHFAGQPTDQSEIWKLSKKYGFKIIEDASHSLGARHRKELVGSCKWSDITVFSFHPVKMITSAEGGAALTNDIKIYDRLKKYSSHGINKKMINMEFAPKGDWYYEQQLLGFNYRLSDLHAALGISQLSKLNKFVLQRNKIAKRYDKDLNKRFITIPHINGNNLSSFHLYVVRIDRGKFPNMHKKVFDTLRRKKIMVNLHYLPIHLHPYYRKLGFKVGDYPIAERFSSEAISIPIFPKLLSKEQDYIIDVIHSCFKTI